MEKVYLSEEFKDKFGLEGNEEKLFDKENMEKVINEVINSETKEKNKMNEVNEKVKVKVTANGKTFRIVPRNESENKDIGSWLDAAIYNLDCILGDISYYSQFNLNQELIVKLNNIKQELDDINMRLEVGELELQKPIKVEDDMHYYELMYFYGRKNTGSRYIQTSLKLDGDEDEFLEKLIKSSVIESSFAEVVTYIEEIDEESYFNMVN